MLKTQKKHQNKDQQEKKAVFSGRILKKNNKQTNKQKQ
jgi:hypothetical protein